MDPELKEKLRVRRLLSEDCVVSSSTSPECELESKRFPKQDPTHEPSDVMETSDSSRSKEVQPGQVASLRHAHEAFAARIATPQRPSPKPSKNEVILEDGAGHGKINYIVHGDEIDSSCIDGAAAEPIEYLMLELMPLLPPETAEHLFRAVRAGEQRTLRLQRSAEVLKTKIDDGRTQHSETKGTTEEMSSTSSHSHVQSVSTVKVSKKNCHCFNFISFAWLCVGILLGVLLIVGYWISVGSQTVIATTGECKDDTNLVTDLLAFNITSPTPRERLWVLRQKLQQIRKRRHLCRCRHQHLDILANRLRSAFCARSREILAKKQSEVLSSNSATPLQTFALEQRGMLQKLELEIKELRRSAAACRRCASAFGVGSTC